MLLALVLYWQLILAEGAYLGPRLVALLYDWTAPRYNRIKDFDPLMEAHTLGLPLANRVQGQPDALVLDVAVGTGRLPLALLQQPAFQGRVIGLDRASKMLAIARRDLAAHGRRVLLLQADAMALPFADNTFYAVTCLEALEFTPDPLRGLGELVRVLRPADAASPRAGWLLFTNRIGWEARFMPGKTWTAARLAGILSQLPLANVQILPWQTIYDLVWAQKVLRPSEQPADNLQAGED